MEKTKPHHLIFEDRRMEIYLHGAHMSGFNNARTICQKHLHHMMFELNMVLVGSQVVMFNDFSYEQHAGELVLIPPMTVHQCKAEKAQYVKYFVSHIKIIDADFLQKIANIAPLFIHQRNMELTVQLKPLIYDLMSKLENNASYVSIFQTILNISVHIERFCDEKASALLLGTELSYKIARKIDELLVNAINTEADLNTNWFEDISFKLGHSRRHCSRVFKEAFAMSPREYLSILRQQEAMQLLMSSEETIEQIAYRIGFGNVQSFIRQFSKWTGQTPGAFRRQESNNHMYLTPLELQY
ncbi:helix-turn-helix domain-containing protein [Paenibacillus provencensis]|uniref:Helix-turn-helix domain-containing protein n=1 Tax=Paenibacillus provencensis TaxID=441151 RepID=A0ABW3PLT1_9BACL|nr:helix-turn-helix domain-containing protein [Paenibacillus sp. MER 78]MCM3127129.1 helix-turn-helix domain-containing protein [Paenibacillus sp. MER 78]